MRAAVASSIQRCDHDARCRSTWIDAAVARPRFNARCSAFAGAALLLAAIGVYGVLSIGLVGMRRDRRQGGARRGRSRVLRLF
jgi:hypothetical protein